MPRRIATAPNFASTPSTWVSTVRRSAARSLCCSAPAPAARESRLPVWSALRRAVRPPAARAAARAPSVSAPLSAPSRRREPAVDSRSGSTLCSFHRCSQPSLKNLHMPEMRCGGWSRARRRSQRDRRRNGSLAGRSSPRDLPSKGRRPSARRYGAKLPRKRLRRYSQKA